ncbi:MAG: hypothetical protein ACTHNU_08120 [Gaiellales bacterium]
MPIRFRHALAVGLLGIAAAAGCGGGGGSHAAKNDVSSKSPESILRTVRRAVFAAHSVHLLGATGSGSSAQSIDLSLAAGKGATGTVTDGGKTFQLLRIGPTAYIRGDAATIKQIAGAQAAQVIGGRWLKVPISDPNYSSLKQLTNLRDLLGKALTPSGKTITKLEPRMVRGVQAIGLQDEGHGTLYVAAKGTPYPIEIDAGQAGSGKIVFSDWNQPVALHAPSNAISIKQIQKAAGG